MQKRKKQSLKFRLRGQSKVVVDVVERGYRLADKIIRYQSSCRSIKLNYN